MECATASGRRDVRSPQPRLAWRVARVAAMEEPIKFVDSWADFTPFERNGTGNQQKRRAAL